MKFLGPPSSGSIAGTTSSHNRAGQYTRNRRTPVNNPTARRTAVRSAFGGASSAWSALTPTLQASWVAAADSHPITDALGQSITLTGHQLFISCTTASVNAGGPVLSTPPPTFSVYSLSGSTAVFSVATGLALTMPGTGDALDYVCIGLSKPVPGGRTFWATFQQAIVDSGDTTSETMATGVYAATFGTPSVGQKVFVRFTPVSEYGVTGVPVIIPVVVTA